jgi:uncharacterized protein
MLHPHTELKFVSEEIGYGIFATCLIPMGTIMWVKDELDRIIPKEDLAKLSAVNLENLMKYSYRNSLGNYVFCWDLTRYVNHSYKPNSILTPLGFEISVRDIQIGEEITNDYGTLNIIEPFQCANGPDHEREFVCPDDLSRHYKNWDTQIEKAFKFIGAVEQPLSKFLTHIQNDEISLIKRGEATIPSVLKNLHR